MENDKNVPNENDESKDDLDESKDKGVSNEAHPDEAQDLKKFVTRDEFDVVQKLLNEVLLTVNGFMAKITVPKAETEKNKSNESMIDATK